MAFQMSFTAPTGITCSASYWHVVTAIINPLTPYMSLNFNGWATQADCVAKHTPIGTKTYTINDPTIFATYFGPTALASSSLYSQMAAFVASVLDTDNGSGTLVSFFNGATTVA